MPNADPSPIPEPFPKIRNEVFANDPMEVRELMLESQRNERIAATANNKNLAELCRALAWAHCASAAWLRCFLKGELLIKPTDEQSVKEALVT